MTQQAGDWLAERLLMGPILGDGAMRTQLFERRVLGQELCLDELSLSAPELVRSVHLDYIAAGSEIVETNTFGANRMRLAAYGLRDRVRQINEAAVNIAREARRLTGQRVWVGGAVGPMGRPLSPPGPITPEQARDVFREQIRSLADAGADLLVFETFGDLREVTEAVLAAREVCELPVVAQMSFAEDGRTVSGDTPAEVVEALGALGAMVVGANCGVGSEGVLRVVQEMASAARVPLSAQPNAGFPMYQGSRVLYHSSPEYMARHARQMVEAGVAIVGGCCGTTPEHIAALRDALKSRGTAEARPAQTSGKRRGRPAQPRTPAPERTGLARKAGEKFIVTVEVSPPRGFEVSPTLDSLSDLNGSGLVDAFNVADTPRAQGRMSALAMSSLIQSRLGTEAILHLALRHRNLVALHSDLLGAHALEVRNLLVIMGDPPSTGDYPGATAISDITASGMIKLIKEFNRGNDATGKPIEGVASFFVGCAFNPGAADSEREARVLERKLAAGADFILTQPVYTPDVIERARQRLGGFPVPVLLGMLPLRSVRHAEFLHNEVPGIEIPGEVMTRLREAGPGAPDVGIQLCRELLEEAGSGVAGIYVVPPFGRYDVVLEVLRGVPQELKDRGGARGLGCGSPIGPGARGRAGTGLAPYRESGDVSRGPVSSYRVA